MERLPTAIQDRFTTSLLATTNEVDGAAGFEARYVHEMDGERSGDSTVRVDNYRGTVEWDRFFPQKEAKEFVPGAGIGTLAHIDVMRDLYFNVLGRERARGLFVSSSGQITAERLRHLSAMDLRSTTQLGMPFPEYLRRSMEFGMTKGLVFPKGELEQLAEDAGAVSGIVAGIRSTAHGVLSGLLNTRDAVFSRPKKRPAKPPVTAA